MDIALEYEWGIKVGWAGPVLARQSWHLLKGRPYFFDGLPIQTTPFLGKRMMLHEVVRKVLGKDTVNYPQQIGDPFVAGTMVLMQDGSEKKIEDVKIGETVINHKGEPAKVTNVIKKKFTGDLVTVKIKGHHREITATETHHGMFLPYSTYRFKYNRCERKKFGELEIGDYMLLPFGSQEIKNHTILYDNGNTIKEIKVDNKFARLIGLYLAEGGLSTGNAVTWSFNSNETMYMEEVKILVKEIFDIDTTIHKTGCDNCLRVSANSPFIKNFFSTLINGNIYTKSIPSLFFTADKSIRLSLIRGWLDGDGYKNFKVNAVIGYTSSDNLGHDMTRLMRSCGLNVKSWTRMRKTRSRVPNTEVALYGTEPYKVYNDVQPTRESKNITCNNTPYGFARPISNITRQAVVNHDVYCITTENEYTAIFNGIAQYQCVSFGAKNAIEYLQCCEILMKGDREKFRPVFPPYLYGTGRVFAGGGRLDGEDGSLGSWMADAVITHGVLASDEPNVPQYDGRVAKKWGDTPGPPNEFILIGKEHPVKSAAKINSWEELVTAICNGYPCTVASNQGFEMEAGADGFNEASGQWGHQMCITGIDDEYTQPYCIILNSWGDAHGRMKDFNSKEDLPIGVLRAKKNIIQRMISSGEVFAYSNFQGFPTQEIAKELFKLI